MVSNLFATKKQRSAALATLKVGRTGAFWLLIQDILRENIEVLKEQILANNPDATKEEMDVKRAKLAAYREVMETPDMIIRALEGPTSNKPDLDPFDKLG